MPSHTQTFLEMNAPTELRPTYCEDKRFWVGEATVPQGSVNRFLYETVGKPWAWLDKLSWSDEQWQTYAESERLKTFVAYYDGSPAGYFELLWDDAQGIEVAYFGLMPAFIGRGLGGALLTQALEKAWELAPQRVWLHTCTKDHPAALQNYLARGLSITATQALAPKDVTVS